MSWMTVLPAVVVAVLAIPGSAPATPPQLEPVSASESAEEAPMEPPLEPVEITDAHTHAGPPPAEVLRTWDARRADAWADGDLAALAGLYTSGSVAGRRDRAMLRAWRARGLVVRGLRTQLLAVRELRRTRSTWTLQVTDRLAGGVAVGRSFRSPLPVDQATTRFIELRLVGGHWLVAAVTQ